MWGKSRPIVKFPLYTRVALAEDLPQDHICRGDVATIVEYYQGTPGQEPGYELEVFNALGDTFAVVTVCESQIESLRRDELLSVRPHQLAPACLVDGFTQSNTSHNTGII